MVVGLIDGEFVLNPTVEQREKSDLHLTVSGTKDAVMMVEAGAKEVSEEKMLQAILFAHEEIKKLVAFQERHRCRNRQRKARVPAGDRGRGRDGGCPRICAGKGAVGV